MISNIVVVGSFVYDLVVWLPYFPRKGETLLASKFKMYAGGKGFNQAVSAKRCGAQVSMVGKVGADQFGTTFIELMDREGIDHSFVSYDASTTTSLGIPMIDPHGDNSIIGIPRANTHVTIAEIEGAKSFISQHQILLIQLEIPLEAALYAARIAHAAGLTVIINPAPAMYPLSSLLQQDDLDHPVIDWLIPNEVEAEMLSGIPVHNPGDAFKAGQYILTQGVNCGVIITMGDQGAVAITPNHQYHVPPFPISPLDPTGAGDAFCGAFAAAISEGKSLEQALRFANAAGALAATIAGAEPSLPKRDAIEEFMKQNP